VNESVFHQKKHNVLAGIFDSVLHPKKKKYLPGRKLSIFPMLPFGVSNLIRDGERAGRISHLPPKKTSFKEFRASPSHYHGSVMIHTNPAAGASSCCDSDAVSC
jgi:hypothetical protein